MTARFVGMAFVGLLACGAGAWAHGTERHFGTSINGRVRSDSEGSSAFTLMALESNSKAILRAIEEGRAAEARQRAQRLPQLVGELQKRSEKLDAPMRERAVEATSAISKSAARIGAAAEAADATSVRRELAELHRLVAAMEEVVRESPEQ